MGLLRNIRESSLLIIERTIFKQIRVIPSEIRLQPLKPDLRNEIYVITTLPKYRQERAPLTLGDNNDPLACGP